MYPRAILCSLELTAPQTVPRPSRSVVHLNPSASPNMQCPSECTDVLSGITSFVPKMSSPSIEKKSRKPRSHKSLADPQLSMRRLNRSRKQQMLVTLQHNAKRIESLEKLLTGIYTESSSASSGEEPRNTGGSCSSSSHVDSSDSALSDAQPEVRLYDGDEDVICNSTALFFDSQLPQRGMEERECWFGDPF